jgi:hypothetical protein
MFYPCPLRETIRSDLGIAEATERSPPPLVIPIQVEQHGLLLRDRLFQQTSYPHGDLQRQQNSLCGYESKRIPACYVGRQLIHFLCAFLKSSSFLSLPESIQGRNKPCILFENKASSTHFLQLIFLLHRRVNFGGQRLKPTLS